VKLFLNMVQPHFMRLDFASRF